MLLRQSLGEDWHGGRHVRRVEGVRDVQRARPDTEVARSRQRSLDCRSRAGKHALRHAIVTGDTCRQALDQPCRQVCSGCDGCHPATGLGVGAHRASPRGDDALQRFPVVGPGPMQRHQFAEAMAERCLGRQTEPVKDSEAGERGGDNGGLRDQGFDAVTGGRQTRSGIECSATSVKRWRQRPPPRCDGAACPGNRKPSRGAV